MEAIIVQEQVLRGFEHLSQQDVAEGCMELSSRLIKLGKVSTRPEAAKIINETLTRLLDENYRTKFSGIQASIETRGIAISKSFQKQLWKSMTFQYSIYDFFAQLNAKNKYHNSGMSRAIRNARGIHAGMNANTSLTFKIQ